MREVDRTRHVDVVLEGELGVRGRRSSPTAARPCSSRAPTSREAPEDSSALRASRGRILVTASSTVSPLSSGAEHAPVHQVEVESLLRHVLDERPLRHEVEDVGPADAEVGHEEQRGPDACAWTRTARAATCSCGRSPAAAWARPRAPWGSSPSRRSASCGGDCGWPPPASRASTSGDIAGISGIIVKSSSFMPPSYPAVTLRVNLHGQHACSSACSAGAILPGGGSEGAVEAPFDGT